VLDDSSGISVVPSFPLSQAKIVKNRKIRPNEYRLIDIFCI
jgi:hypothetical protein